MTTPSTIPVTTTLAGSHAPAPTSTFRQPKAVWAVAFACVVSFMGIGLVDPILPALSTQLHASPSQVSLLFTSYLVVTAVAMLATGWVSSRIGAKRTLIAGLALIVVFAAAAGSAGGISGIVGFRAGWGLGNALFVATSLAVIVSSATGSFAGAIILYETALGLGIAVGPLLGGELGTISWRGPFFGVSALMLIALVATALMVPSTPAPARPTSLLDPLRALRHRGLRTMSLTALAYNWGFFTMLGFAPFPMHLGVHQLGYVFTAWGVLVATFSVFVAPRLQARFGTAPTLYVNLAGLAVVMLVMAIWTTSTVVLATAVIVAGAFIGINNTLTTQAVMTVSPVERPVASAAYGFVRFIGGGLAPFVAGRLAEHLSAHAPFFLGSAAFLLGIAVLATGHRVLTEAERAQVVEAQVAVPGPAPAIAGGTPTAPGPAPALVSLPGLAASIDEKVTGAPPAPGAPAAAGPIVLAVVDGPDTSNVVDTVADLARREGAPVDLVHVLETDVIWDTVVDREPPERAHELVSTMLSRLSRAGVPAAGHLLHSVGDHAAVGRLICEHARSGHARAIVVGVPSHRLSAALREESATMAVLRDAPCDVLVIRSARRDDAAVGRPARATVTP